MRDWRLAAQASSFLMFLVWTLLRMASLELASEIDSLMMAAFSTCALYSATSLLAAVSLLAMSAFSATIILILTVALSLVSLYLAFSRLNLAISCSEVRLLLTDRSWGRVDLRCLPRVGLCSRWVSSHRSLDSASASLDSDICRASRTCRSASLLLSICTL